MRRASRSTALALAACALLGACRQDMHDQPRYEPLEKSSFFRDGRSVRPAVPGTVARGRLFEDQHLHAGRVDGAPAATFPYEITRADLERGRERYGIYCTPCHAPDGGGEGMIVQRGMRRPTSFHEQRLVDAPPGYFFDVITNGFGAMFDYSDRIEARDRWAIVAWVRVLQRSRRGTLDDLTPEQREELARR
jgi:mono/diheme cytochrome c family protein